MSASGTSTLSTQDLLTDALDSVLAAFNATPGSAAALGNQAYGPYGNALYTQGVMGTARGYTGQYGDSVGLDYYNARYYDPVVGLFLSVDTKQDNLHGFDPYAYVLGNPETMTDPTGRCDNVCLWMGAALDAAEALDLIIWATGAAREVDLEWSDSINGRTPTPDEIATSRLRGDMNGVFYTIAAVATVACVIAEPCGAVTAATIAIGGFIAGTFIINEFSRTMDAMANKFYQDHPVVDVNSQIHDIQQLMVGPILQKPANKNIFVPPAKPPSPLSGQTFSYQSPSSSQQYTGELASRPSSSQQHNGGPGSYTVVSGDTLWGIAARFYGSGSQWGRIYGANQGVIGGNPNLIYPGERLAIPR